MGDKYQHGDTEGQRVTSEGDTARKVSSAMVADDACVMVECIKSVYDDFYLEETVNASIDSKAYLDDDVFEVTTEICHDGDNKDTGGEFCSSRDSNDRFESSAEIKSGDDVKKHVTFCHIVALDKNGTVDTGVDTCHAVSNPVEPGIVNRGFSDLSPFVQFLHQIGKPLSVALSDNDGTSVTKVTGENTGNPKGELVQNMRSNYFLCEGGMIYLTYCGGFVFCHAAKR